MVDISDKSVTKRMAQARAIMHLPEEIIAAFTSSDIESKKGPVFQTAILAGIMGAKKTSDLIPLCHPLALDNCHVDIHINDQNEVVIDC
ncbi:UNVERIFIED_CONTAM: hypothetical protein GTU68_031351, partial [Idotea baltica]|nr:hypothetical protein [Idotea baltica]